MNLANIGALAVVLILAVALHLLTRRRRQAERPLLLRPLPAYDNLHRQVGRAIESGRRVHIGFGRGRLIERDLAASLGAWHIVRRLARESYTSNVPPLITVGEGTLLPAALDAVRPGPTGVGRPAGPGGADAVEFVADRAFPFTYGGGVAARLHRSNLASNIVVGHVGAEVALMTEAATRCGMEQIIGSDDPTGLAVATAVTDDVIIGEELLAAPAYLSDDPAAQASLQLQDILRWLFAGALIVGAGWQLLTGG